MNEHFNVQCMCIGITDDKETFEHHGTYYAGNITVEKAKEALKFIQGASLVKIYTQYGTYFIVTKLGSAEKVEIITKR